MFEDSTFESTGRIRTRSRRWMFATFALNGSILLALILVPLIYPNALPSHMMPALLVAPEVPKPETPPQPEHVRPAAPHEAREFDNGRITAPPSIPTTIRYLRTAKHRHRTTSPPPTSGPAVRVATAKASSTSGQPVTVVHTPAPSNHPPALEAC